MAKKKPKFRVGRKLPEEVATTFEERQEQRMREQPTALAMSFVPDRDSANAPEKSVSHVFEPAGPQPSEPVNLQARNAVPAGAESGAVRRGRGGWTKENPYTRKDGVVTRSTTVYLPVELAGRLRRYAFEADRKQSDVIVEALELLLSQKPSGCR